MPLQPLLLKAALHVTARVRFGFVLKCLQHIYKKQIRSKLLTLFDPNTIRKHVRYNNKENIRFISSGVWKLAVDVNDHVGYWSYIKNKPFEETVFNLASELGLGEKDVILDIGANIGSATIPICANLGCELIAVEASRITTQLLAKNIVENGIRAHLNTLALTNQEGGFVKLYLRPGNTGANSVHPNWNPSVGRSDFEYTPCTTLDRLAASSDAFDRVSLIKMDVEGSELAVIRGGKKFLAKTDAAIIMEYRPDISGKGEDSVKSIVEELKSEYRVHALDCAGKKIEFDPSKPYDNIILQKLG